MLNRWVKAACLSVLLITPGVSPLVFAEQKPTAIMLLDRMSHSFRELSYRGIFSYQQGQHMESFRIVHAVFNGQEYERLESLDGEPREIVRRGHSLSCKHPGDQLIRIYHQQQSFKQGPRRAQAAVSKYYQFAIAGNSRVAGREVVEIKVTPVDEYRFGHSLAVDSETGLLLRSSLVSNNGEVMERFQFVEINVGIDVPMAYFQPSEHSYHAGHNSPPDSDTTQLPAGKAWQVNWLPGGFTATEPGSDMRTFTDGLTVVSVFLEDTGDSGVDPEGRAQKGATIAYSRTLSVANSSYRVTVVGEIPYSTAKKIAKSVTLAGL